MKHIRKLLVMLMCLFLMPLYAGAEAEKLPLQDAHRATLKQQNKTQQNGSVVYWWEIKTAQAGVDAELNALVRAYRDEMAPTLSRPAKDQYSRLDVNVLRSRTGLTWMSFMVQSRYVLNKQTMDVQFTTRTYDMATGERILLKDIFPEDSEAWGLLEEAVRAGIQTYYPDLTPVQEAYEAACTRAAIEEMDFTLHGMSLVLHLHAADFYPEKEQLIQITLYYPQIRPYMTEKAQIETDNLTYYNTVALTYDDGPNGWVTRETLNELLKAGERATFFVVGERIPSHEQYIRREHDEAHAVATHNYKHAYADRTKAAELLKLKDQAEAIHLKTLGIKPAYARAPGGYWEQMGRAGLGWPLIQWSAAGSDITGTGDGRNPNAVTYDVMNKVKDGGIILMHDMQPNSFRASGMFIPRLQEKGYIFLTVDELFAKDGVELQPDTAYWCCVNGVTTVEK